MYCISNYWKNTTYYNFIIQYNFIIHKKTEDYVDKIRTYEDSEYSESSESSYDYSNISQEQEAYSVHKVMYYYKYDNITYDRFLNQINTIKILKALIKIDVDHKIYFYNYWDLDGFSKPMIKFIIKNLHYFSKNAYILCLLFERNSYKKYNYIFKLLKKYINYIKPLPLNELHMNSIFHNVPWNKYDYILNIIKKYIEHIECLIGYNTLHIFQFIWDNIFISDININYFPRIYEFLIKLNRLDKIEELYDCNIIGIRRNQNLIYAAYNNNLDIIKYLLQRKCKPNNDFIEITIRQNNRDIIEYIFEKYPEYLKIEFPEYISNYNKIKKERVIINYIVKNNLIEFFKNNSIYKKNIEEICMAIIIHDKMNYIDILEGNYEYFRYNIIKVNDIPCYINQAQYEFNVIKYIFNNITKEIAYILPKYEYINNIGKQNIFENNVIEIFSYNCRFDNSHIEYGLINGYYEQLCDDGYYLNSNIILKLLSKTRNNKNKMNLLKALEFCISFQSGNRHKMIYMLKKIIK